MGNIFWNMHTLLLLIWEAKDKGVSQAAVETSDEVGFVRQKVTWKVRIIRYLFFFAAGCCFLSSLGLGRWFFLYLT